MSLENNLSHQLIDNKEAKQYEFHIGEVKAKIEYIIAQDKIFLTHTEVPKQLEGQGIGKDLVLQVLKDIEKREFTLVPLCPFVALYIKRHPEWRKLVMKGVNIS